MKTTPDIPTAEDISEYFTNSGRIRKPVQQVNVDLSFETFHELDCVHRVIEMRHLYKVLDFLNVVAKWRGGGRRDMELLWESGMTSVWNDVPSRLTAVTRRMITQSC